MIKTVQNKVIIQKHIRRVQGGLIRPYAENKETFIGTVIACGSDCVDLQVGDVVTYPRHSFKRVTYSGQEYRVGREIDVLAVVEGIESPLDLDKYQG